MQRHILVALVILGAAFSLGLWIASAPAPLLIGIDLKDGEASRGKLIFDAGGCASCHMTKGQEDRLQLGGGRALNSPFGVFVAPNISSHPRDGIGQWSARDLVNAMKRGVSPRGEHYYPAFPYTTYARARIGDIADLMAYLRSLPAVEGRAPDHRLSFPFTLRRGLGLWKALYLDLQDLPRIEGETPEMARGRYLSEALAHCAECHSGRDLLGGIRRDQRYAGGPDLEGDGFVPNISQHESALANWSLKDIDYLLARGALPDGDYVGGSMADVVTNMAELPAADRTAIAAYVKSLPALPTTPKK
jgi:mono/diheme cytochrome c family protein